MGVSYLLATGKEEPVRIRSIVDCAADEWDPVEDQRRPSLVQHAKQELIGDIQGHDCHKSQQGIGPNPRPGHGDLTEIGTSKPQEAEEKSKSEKE